MIDYNVYYVNYVCRRLTLMRAYEAPAITASRHGQAWHRLAPIPGIDPGWAAVDDVTMQTPFNPDRPTPTAAEDQQLRAWMELRDQMQVLHAQLEYVRLLLKLQSTKR